jgi:hypothetical protein
MKLCRLELGRAVYRNGIGGTFATYPSSEGSITINIAMIWTTTAPRTIVQCRFILPLRAR